MSKKDLSNIALLYEMVAYKRSGPSLIDDIIDGIDIYGYDEEYEDEGQYDDNNWREELVGITTISDENIANRLQDQYQKAIGRTSTYVGDLYNHILSHSGRVLFDDRDESAVVGYPIQLRGGSAFIVSHFAPYSLRSGVNLIKYLSKIDHPIIIAVPDYQSRQLSKAGFRKVGIVPQHFDGEVVMKNVMANDYADDNKLKELMKTFHS